MSKLSLPKILLSLKLQNKIRKWLYKRNVITLLNEQVSLKRYESEFGKDSVSQKRFYNIGAGAFLHPAWTNVDTYSDHYKANKIDIDWDITKRKRMPVSSGSANIVYSSHTIEHIDDESASHMFKESFRILKKGGIIRITCPDQELALKAYIRNDHLFFYFNPKNKIFPMELLFLERFFPIRKGARFTNSDMKFLRIQFLRKDISKGYKKIYERFDKSSAPEKHRNWWTYDKLHNHLKKAGFQIVYRSAYGQSASPVLRDTYYFDSTHPKISLYMEAIK